MLKSEEATINLSYQRHIVSMVTLRCLSVLQLQTMLLIFINGMRWSLLSTLNLELLTILFLSLLQTHLGELSSVWDQVLKMIPILTRKSSIWSVRVQLIDANIVVNALSWLDSRMNSMNNKITILWCSQLYLILMSKKKICMSQLTHCSEIDLQSTSKLSQPQMFTSM